MNDKGNIIIYQTKDGQTLIDVRLENETVWINRQQMAELFDRDVKTIGKHITNAERISKSSSRILFSSFI